MREWTIAAPNAQSSYIMVLHASRRPFGKHVRRYNREKASKAEALISATDYLLLPCREFVINRRSTLNSKLNKGLSEMSINHISYNSMEYFLLFLTGLVCWNNEITVQISEGRVARVRPRKFYAWKLFEYENVFSTILRSARLYQQYAADKHCTPSYELPTI